MGSLTYIFGALVLVGAILATVAIWSPRRVWIKLTAITTTMALFALGYTGFAELLSKPKPVGLEWVMSAVPEATVLGSKSQEGEAIYVWLELDGGAEPRAYRIPWSTELAQQLQDATRAAEAQRTGVMMRRPFDTLFSQMQDDPVFYSAPRTPPTPKNDASSQPFVFGSTR